MVHPDYAYLVIGQLLHKRMPLSDKTQTSLKTYRVTVRCIPTRATCGSMHASVSNTKPGDNLDLDSRILWQSSNLDCGASGRLYVEVTSINFIHGFEIAHVN